MHYKLKEKQNRNERLHQFWLTHQDWTYKAIGAVFHISGVRAWGIIKREKVDKKGEGE